MEPPRYHCIMETWLQIKGFPGYEVSDHGRVRSVSRYVIRNGSQMRVKETILKPRALQKGHLYVNLRKDGKATSAYVHRLVALAFIEPPDATRTHVAHWDGDPSNNHVSNLRWATPAENNADSIRLGRNRRPSGEKSRHAKLTRAIIAEMQMRNASGESIRSIAKRVGVSHTTARAAIIGKRYKDEAPSSG